MKTFKDMRNIIKEGKDIPKGYHKMPDGTIMKDSEHKTENVKVNPNARETETQNASDKKSKAKASYNQTVQKIKGMRMQEENKKGFLQGAEAAKTGKKYSENPHPKDSAEHLQWAKGHNQHRANKLTNESEIKDKKDNLPPHIKALMKKVSGKTMPSSKPTMKDVTPKGYGPNEESEELEELSNKLLNRYSKKAKKEGVMQRNGTDKVGRIQEEKDEREYGYEGDMAMTQLKTIMRHADHLMGMLKPETDLPEWVQSKITLATDYMQTAHDYLMSEMNESLEENELDEALGNHMGLMSHANKNGGVDKKDMHTAANHIKVGNMSQLKTHLSKMDTDPRDKVLDYVDKKHYKYLGYIKKEEVDESAAHKFLATKLKNMETQKNFATGQSRIPTPAERKAMYDKEQEQKNKLKKEEHMLSFEDYLKESSCGKTKKEELHPNQKQLDKNKNGKLDKDDFKKLSGEEKDIEKEGFVSHAQRKAVWASKNEKGVKEEDAELDETLTPQLVKHGIGIARDKRYAGNNMTGATKAMDKLHPKLQNHPRVAAELKKQNEEAELEEQHEELDELSKKTLSSYVKDAAMSAAQNAHQVGQAGGRISKIQKPLDKMNKRLNGIDSATTKLAKEEDVKESYEKGRGSTGIAFAIKKGHPDAENPVTRKKYPERQTPKYKAQWASKHKGTMDEDFDLDASTPLSFNDFKSMMEKYTGADRQADAKAKRESDPNYAYSDHYKKNVADKPKNTVTKHTGTYGKEYDGDDEKQAKPETTDKRGRGRPSGSKSGARQKGAGVHDGGIPVHNLNLPNNRR